MPFLVGLPGVLDRAGRFHLARRVQCIEVETTMGFATATFHLFKDAIKAYFANRASIYAAGLAYYAVFAIAPLLVFIIWLASIFVGRSAAVEQINEQIQYLVGPEVTDLLTELAQAVNQRTFGPGATILGLFALIFSAAGIFNQLDRALNEIWGIRAVRPQSIGERMILIRRRAAPVIVLFFFGLLFTSSIMVDTLLGLFSSFVAEFLPQLPDLSLHINRLIIPLLAFVTFCVIFKWLPDAHVRWRDVAVGALVSTLLFLLGRVLLTFYLERSGTGALFGTVGSIVVLLIWVYYSAQVLLFGAEFTKLYADRFGQPIVPHRLAAFEDVLHEHNAASFVGPTAAGMPDDSREVL